MQEFSKYRAITVGFILMFIFAIAAIYSNTKDAVENKMQNNQEISQQNNDQSIKYANNNSTYNINEQKFDSSIDLQISQISTRLSQLEQKFYASQNNQGVSCNVKGIIDDGNFVPLSPEESVTESRMNNREVLITCVFR